jgi:hypothetical protein
MELSTTTLLGGILGLIGVALLPLGGIWALNTIFATGLEYTFLNWLAILFGQLYLQLIIKAGNMHSQKKK